MKRLIIISSEPLNPDYQIGSIFELAQASALKDTYKVAILAVRYEGAVYNNLKALAKATISFSFSEFKAEIKRVFTSLFYCFRLKENISHYVIDEIDVIECVYFSLYYSSNIIKRMNRWAFEGRKGFLSYSYKVGYPELIHAHGRFLDAGWLALILKREFKIPFVYTEHSTYYQTGKAPVSSIPILKVIVKEASKVIAVSPQLLIQMELFLKQNITNAIVLPNIVNKKFERVLPISIQSNVFEFISIATLEHRKGIDLLIKAFSVSFVDRNDVCLTIVGDGPMLANYQKLVTDLLISDKVKFLPAQSKEVIIDLLDRSDAFVLPSRSETFGVVIIEALVRGLPVISTICGGPEFIITPENGILIQKDNMEQLSSALTEINLEISRFNRQSIQSTALEKFGNMTFLREIAEVYQAV